MFSQSGKTANRGVRIYATQTTPNLTIDHYETTEKPDGKQHQIFPINPWLLKGTLAAHWNNNRKCTKFIKKKTLSNLTTANMLEHAQTRSSVFRTHCFVHYCFIIMYQPSPVKHPRNTIPTRIENLNREKHKKSKAPPVSGSIGKTCRKL